MVRSPIFLKSAFALGLGAAFFFSGASSVHAFLDCSWDGSPQVNYLDVSLRYAVHSSNNGVNGATFYTTYYWGNSSGDSSTYLGDNNGGNFTYGSGRTYHINVWARELDANQNI